MPMTTDQRRRLLGGVCEGLSTETAAADVDCTLAEVVAEFDADPGFRTALGIASMARDLSPLRGVLGRDYGDGVRRLLGGICEGLTTESAMEDAGFEALMMTVPLAELLHIVEKARDSFHEHMERLQE